MAKEAVVTKDAKVKPEETKTTPPKSTEAPKGVGVSKTKKETTLPEGVVEIGKDAEGKAILQSSFTNGVATGFDYVNDLPWSYVVPNEQNNPWLEKAKDGQLITTRVLSDKEIAQLETPYVIINGVKIEPSLTSLTTNKEAHYWDIAGREHQQFHQVPDEKGEYALYKVVIEGRKLSILMDKHSKFVVRDENVGRAFFGGRFDYREPSDRNLPASVTLHNSDVYNTFFLGHSTLQNVSLKDCVSNQCKFTAMRLHQGHSFLGAYPEVSPFEDETTNRRRKEPVEITERDRHTFEGVRARQCHFTDTLLSAGHYYRSNITKSTVDGNKWVRLSEAHLTSSRVRASTVSIEKATLMQCSFEAEANFHHGAFYSQGENLSVSSAFLPNKFSLARIPMPDQDLTLVRATENEFELFMYSSGPRINVNADADQIASAVHDVVRQGDWRDVNPGQSVLTNSIEKYVIDTIVCRLNVINTLDGVVRMAADLKRDYGHNEDIYGSVL